jgi:hypothetical protein
MSASGSDYVPSEHSDEDQAAPAPVLDDDGVTEDDYLSGFSTGMVLFRQSAGSNPSHACMHTQPGLCFLALGQQSTVRIDMQCRYFVRLCLVVMCIQH